MIQVETEEPFVTYSALLEAQVGLRAGLRDAGADQAVTLYEDIARIDRDVELLEHDSDLPQSALRHGALLAYEVAVLRNDEQADDAAREGYARRLRMVSAFILARGVGEQELTEDPRFYEVQAALGGLAADSEAPLPAAPAAEISAVPVDYEVALDALLEHVSAMPPGASYKLSPAQVLSLAAPDMAFSRWQRYRLLRRARETLMAEGYTFSHNNGRGRSSAYTIGRPAQEAHAAPLPAQRIGSMGVLAA